MFLFSHLLDQSMFVPGLLEVDYHRRDVVPRCEVPIGLLPVCLRARASAAGALDKVGGKLLGGQAVA